LKKIRQKTLDKFSVKELEREQARLSCQVITQDMNENYDLVAGVDVAYKKGSAYGVCVVISQDFQNIEVSKSHTRVSFPYVPGFFSYRELEPALKAVKSIPEFDVLMVNGHGIAHPRKFGLASHLGLIINKPTIGVAKKLLVGEIKKFDEKEAIIYRGEIVGVKIFTSTGSPVYISVGHMISLDTSVRIVKRYLKENRLPEPLTRAHNIAQNIVKNSEI
jgi:deoxyribonuclease V